MPSIKGFFLVILGLNILSVIILGFNQYNSSTANNHSKPVILQEERRAEEIEQYDQVPEELEEAGSAVFKFDDPQRAKKILEQLDIFEIVNPEDLPTRIKYKTEAEEARLNDKYCEQHRDYFVQNAQELFENKKIWTNYWNTHKLIVDVIPEMGAKRVKPVITPKDKHSLTLDAQLFFTSNLYFKSTQIGKQFSCLSQASNHIPGHDKMYRKDWVGQALVDYARAYESRPQCFGFDKYFPKTWLLSKKDQCDEFFEEFNSEKYQNLKAERGVVYFRKIGAGVHEGKGVFPVGESEEERIRNTYKNGTACGKVGWNNLIQYNIHNLLLVHNRKFGFRSFMMVASSNPVIAYYHDGYARLSLNEYDSRSKDIKTFVTNIGVNLKAATQDGPFKGMTEEQINERTCWFLEDFHNYLMEKRLVTDPNWLDNYLRPEFKKVMVHLVRMAQDGFLKRSSVFEIYGLDFVMDQDLQLWFIECNTMPLMDGFTKGSTKLLNRMLSDGFEIVYSLLRSRMKRVINYVNMITKALPNGSTKIPNLAQKRLEFKEIIKNNFDPQFPISSDNTFQLLINDNLSGTERFAGLIAPDCL